VVEGNEYYNRRERARFSERVQSKFREPTDAQSPSPHVLMWLRLCKHCFFSVLC